MRILTMNKAMQKLYSPEWDLRSIILPNGLDRKVEDGIVWHNGCYVFRTDLKANPHIRIDQCQDRTGYESFLNHTHIVDFGDDRLCVAFAFLQRVSDVLVREFPDQEFLGIISSDLEGRDCVARFHARHEGEPGWLGDVVEGNPTEPVCLLDLSNVRDSHAGAESIS